MRDESTRVREFAIIGGGLAGSALAIRLRQAGRDVVLFEKERFPRDKLCGEFLSPESRALLDRLGCLDAILDRGAVPIHRARFTSTGGRSLETELPAPGLGVSRVVLDATLFERARQLGATAHEEAEVSVGRKAVWGEDVIPLDVRIGSAESRATAAQFQARSVVGAHGRRTRLDDALGRAFVSGDYPYLGFKLHHRPLDGATGDRLRNELAGVVEIHTFRDGYCGLSFVEGGKVNVCMLTSKTFVSSLRSARWPDIRDGVAAENPKLAERLTALDPLREQALAVGHVPFCFKEQADDRVIYVGDSAGMIAPFCGGGQTMAISSAFILGDLLASLPRRFGVVERRRLAREWTRVWLRRYRKRLVVGRALQSVLLRPRLAHLLLGCAVRCPSLVARLVRWTREDGALDSASALSLQAWGRTRTR